jgi:hypothetical protein
VTDYKNIRYLCKKYVMKMLFGISEYFWWLIASIRFSRRDHGLISKENIQKFVDITQPGDILLSRGNWHATNITIPWFWKHMSLYLWRGEFLQKQFLNRYACIKKLNPKKHYVIEATGDWVEIVELNDFMDHNDYVWVTRTKFWVKRIYKAIEKSLWFYGMWYDHIFNFYSDTGVVCSELVLKSYAPKKRWWEGLVIPLEKIWISLTFPPNNLVKIIFDQWSDLVPILFIDAKEWDLSSNMWTLSEFKQSWYRSRFSFLLK